MTLAADRLAALRAGPGMPLLIDRTQARVELSRATFDNWVTKTVNFLRLEANLDPGSRVAVALPLHWMTAVWVAGVWEAGCDLVLNGDAELVVGSDTGDVVTVLDPLGMAPPPADADAEWFFPADVRGMPDALVLPAADPGGMPGVSALQLAARARDFAHEVGLTDGGCLQTELPPSDLAGVLAMIGAPLAVAGSAVLGPGSGEAVTAVA